MRRFAAAGDRPTRRPTSVAERRPSSSSSVRIELSISSMSARAIRARMPRHERSNAQGPCRRARGELALLGAIGRQRAHSAREPPRRRRRRPAPRRRSTPSSAGCSGSRRASSTTRTACARRRPGVKVGGHQASSASMVSIMTALYFEHLRGARPRLGQAARRAGPARDRVPARHARPPLPDDAARVRRPAVLPEPAQGPGSGRLLDRLGRDRRHRADLERARAPLRRRPLRRARRAGGRSRCVGDAELDEGAIWEALVDPIVPQLGEVLWIVDLNRQSLDRVVPDIAAGPDRRRCSRPPAGRRSTSSTGRRLERAVRARRRRGAAPRGSTRCRTRSTSGCCARRPASCASACPGTGARPRGRRAARRRPRRRRAAARDPRPRRPRPRRCCSTRSPQPTRSPTARR